MVRINIDHVLFFGLFDKDQHILFHLIMHQNVSSIINQKYILIQDQDPGIAIDLLSIPNHYIDDLENVKISNGLILDRTEALATQIFDDYGDEPLVCLCLLKGGFRFFSDLTSKLQRKNRTSRNRSLPMLLDYIHIKNIDNKSFSKEIEISSESIKEIFGKNVLIIDNMVDSGNTFIRLCKVIEDFNPKSIKTCSLLLKRTSKNLGFLPDYVGFSIPDQFVVGYALDLNEHFRDLEHICVMRSTAFKKYTY